MSLWLGPVLSVCKERLGREETDIYIKREDITFIPLEVIKGTSLSSNDPNRPIVFLVDEAEDLSKDEVIKLIIEVDKKEKRQNGRMLIAKRDNRGRKPKEKEELER